MSFTEHITKETVEDEIEKYNLIGPDYDEDNDTRDKVKLTGKGIDFKALEAGKDVEFEIDPAKEEDVYNWEDENDSIDYEAIFKHKKAEMIFAEEESDNENEITNKEAKTPFEVLRLKMTDITENKDKGVLKRVIETGIGPLITPGSRVRIHYNGYFELNDEPFDSTYLRNKSFEFKLGANEVVLGLDTAVATMRKKEKSQFIFEPDYYCGKIGCAPRIPENTPVLFEIEVISYVEANEYDQYERSSDEQRQKLTLDQILKICNCLRELGNDNYERKNYREASKKYRKSIYLLDNVSVKDDDEEKRWKATMLKLYLNMSQICLKQNKPKKTIYYCKLSLDIDAQNVKALFRYGSSLRLLQDFDRARRFLVRAYNLAPSNNDIALELQRLDEMIARYKTIEKNMYSRMFNTNTNNSNESSAKAIVDTNNNVSRELIMEEKNSLEKSRNLIMKKIKEFTEDSNSNVYNIQMDMYSLDIINFVLEQARAFNLESREIKGPMNILQIMKKI